MDPGESHLDRLKAVPNLVEEDPSIITPQHQKSYLDMSWEELSDMLKQYERANNATQRRHNDEESSLSMDSTPVSSITVPTPQDDIHPPAFKEGQSEAGWDSGTGYQDKDHTPSLIKE